MPLRPCLVSAVALTIMAAPAGTARPRSHPLGHPWAGALAGAAQLPASGSHFFTWDPVLRRSPDRPWRRYGTERLVRLVLRVIDGYGAAHPRAPRVGIGDLSGPHGGDFGVRYGRPGLWVPRTPFGLSPELDPGPARIPRAPHPASQSCQRLLPCFTRARGYQTASSLARWMGSPRCV